MSFEKPLQLTAEQARHIFETIIVPSIGAEGTRPQHPTLIVVAGQPGSGKSTAIRQAEMGLTGATQKIIDDDFAAFVPGYHEFARNKPVSAWGFADQASKGYFIEETLGRAERMGANVIRECAVPTHSAQYAGRYRQLGYRSELHIVATPRYQSWTGVLDRTEKSLSNGHIGTNAIPRRDTCDGLYAGWARAVFNAEQQMQYDRVVITRRDGNVMYDNHLVRQRDGTVRWAKPAQGLEALLQERHRAVSHDDATRAREAWDRIVLSGHMKSHDELRSLPLEHYGNEIVGFVGSEASRVTLTTRDPGKFSPKAVEQWQKHIIADLSLTRSSRNQFGYSEEFDRRIHQYGAGITAVAKEYYRSRPITRPQNTPSQQRADISNFSLPTETKRTNLRFDTTGTGALLASSKRAAISNQAKPPKLEHAKKGSDRVRTALRSLQQKTKEVFENPFGLRQVQREAPTLRQATDTSKRNGDQAKDLNIAGQISQRRDGRQEMSATTKIAKDQDSGAPSQEKLARLRRALEPRDRSGRGR